MISPMPPKPTPKPKRPLPPPPAEPPIERPLPPGQNNRPSIGAGAAVAVALLAALGVGWWLGHRTGAPPQSTQQEEKPSLVAMPVTTPVSATVPPVVSLPQAQESAVTTVSATKPAKVASPPPKPVVVQYSVGPAKPLVPRLPPVGDGHVLDAGQVLYCLATGELLDEVTPHAYTIAAHREIDYQTEQYNRRCGAYSYSAVSMERAMQRFEQIRPQIHARARELMRKWKEEPPTPPMRFRYIEYDDSDW
jgi:hypothetical protein